MEKLYKYNGNLIGFEDYKENIKNCLSEYNYALANIISIAKSANEKEVTYAIKEIIIEYIKDNPNIKIKEVCENLKVRSSYVRELVEEDRITILPQELQNLIIEMKTIEKKYDRENKIKSLQVQLNELNNKKRYTTEVSEKNNRKINKGFHSNIISKRF